MATIPLGATGQATEIVTSERSAAHWGSGLVPTYATPAMVALMESASVQAILQYLEPGQTSVGIEICVKHLAATPVGMRVTARAIVTRVEGRRLELEVSAWDEREPIGQGTHGRAVIDLARFEQRFREKQAAANSSAVNAEHAEKK